jgi:hypothetical protein
MNFHSYEISEEIARIAQTWSSSVFRWFLLDFLQWFYDYKISENSAGRV